MANEKLYKSTTALGAVGTVLFGGLAAFQSMGDTSPKSLEDIASTLSSIAQSLDKAGDIGAEEAEQAVAILISVDEIGATLIKKSTGTVLPGVDAILIRDEPVRIHTGETQSLRLSNGDRVSVSYEQNAGSGQYIFTTNGQRQLHLLGSRLFSSTDAKCFVEFLGVDSETEEAMIRPFCS